jgi:diguanylate cyclase (GGDEF)-like protein/PAS domain S-box-containing protein
VSDARTLPAWGDKPDVRRLIFANAATALAYFLAHRAGMWFVVPETMGSFVWPASGILVALIYLLGPRAVPGIVIGALAANLLQKYGVFASFAIALVNAVEAWLGATLLRRAAVGPEFARLTDALKLAFLGAAVAALVGGIGGPMLLALSGNVPTAALPGSMVTWWMGDALGILIFTPLILSWRSWQPARGLRALAGSVALLAAETALVWFTFSGHLTALIGQPVAYLALPLLVWIALSTGLRTVTACQLIILAFATWGLIQGTGPFVAASPLANHVSSYLFVTITSVMGLVLHAIAQDRRTTAAGLRASLQRFQTLTQLSSDWYWEQDADQRFTLIAGRAIDENKIRVDEVVGKRRWEIPGDVDTAERQRHDEAMARREPFRDLLTTRYNDAGEPRLVSVSGAPVFGDDGTFLGYRGVGRDVTLQRRAESQIEQARNFLDAMVNAIPSPVLVKDAQHRYVGANTAFCRFFGRTLDEVIGTTDYDVFTPEEARFFQETDDRALQGEMVQYERLYRLDGRETWMWTRKTSLTRPDGSRVVLLLLIDVTARRAAEDALKQSEQRFRSLAALSSDWYWEQDSELRFSYISEDAAGKTLLPPEKFLGKTRHELDNQFESDEAREEHRWVLEQRLPFRDLVIMSRDGTRSILVSGEPRFDAVGRFIGYRGVARDISAIKAAEREVLESHRYLEAVINTVPTPVSVKDERHHFLIVNDAFCEWAGHPRERLIGANGRMVLGDEQHQLVRNTDAEALASSEPIEYEARYMVGNRESWTLVRKTGLTRAGGERVVVSAFIDITNLKTVENQLRLSERRFRDFAEAAGEYVWETDAAGRFTFVSSRVQSVIGYEDAELIGHTGAEFMPPWEYERVLMWIRDNHAEDGSFRDLEHRFVTRSGEVLWVQVNAVSLHDAHGKFQGYRGTCRNITDRHKAEERISYLATRDPLTDLPNRLLFNDRLEQGLVNARRKREALALMFIDLDRFKNINDSLGHHVGDLLLQEVAARMQACVRRGDTLSRLGGDEFVVTLEGLQHAEDAAQVAQKIIQSLARPMEIGGHILTTSCSIGISIFPADAEDSAALMKNADTAMYHAKEKGRRNFQFFSREMNIRAVERHNLEMALRLALDRDEFQLFYQPQIDIATGRIAGSEALLRWRHPEKGLLPPSMFIDVAEETGLIEAIGQWVLRAACTQNRTWQNAGYPSLRVSVNISARQFNNPREFAKSTSRILSNTGLDPSHLELEMTESVLLHNADENIAVLKRLGKLGTRIAVDDFGTGYSSLSYLKQLPIHTLKIDRSFVRDLESDKDSEVIVNTIIAMGHSLKLRITAEGVENLAQLSVLKRLGCDEYQGFLFAKPMPAGDFAQRFLAPRELNFGS